MRFYLWICVYFAVLTAPLAAAPTLMPQPAQLTLTGGELQLAGTVAVQVVATTSAADLAEAENAIHSGLALLARTHPELKWQSGTAHTAQLQIQFQRYITMPSPADDERYQLEVNAQQIKLSAATSTGALYGLMTLNQLLQCTNSHCTVPTLAIQDQPRYRWRGLLLDSARRFIAPGDIKRTLDGMASAKLNVLHWHVTDDQAWRIESKRYPKLQQLASHGQFYSQADVKDIVRYAAARGIRVVPELDVPGHASAIGMAYPELLAWPDAMPHAPLAAERRFGVFNPVLDISAAATWQFIDAIVTEWRDLFPDPYLHIGGDEVKPAHWLANSAMQQWMRQQQVRDGHAIQAKFNQQLAQLLQRQQRQMIGWDETLHPQLPLQTLVQSWQGQDALGAAARAGHPTLLSAGFYLDMPQSARYHWRNDPSQITTPIAQPVAAQQQFSFVLQRLNGKALSGHIRWGQDSHGDWLASIELSGRGVVAAQLQRWPVDKAQQVRLDASTFVGPLQLRFELDRNQISNAVAMIGNHRYTLTIEAEPYQAVASVAPLTSAQQALLWGGEAALWTELVPADGLDSKLWPRLYVVAERLWSPATQAATTTLSPRLAAMDQYAQQLGLLHQQQAHNRLQQWAKRHWPTLSTSQWQALQQWVSYLQPLHYYGRHNLKTAAGRYHLDEPLHQLADALALEPPALLALQHAFDTSPACQLPAQWPTWQQAWHGQQQLAALARQQPELQQALAQQQQWLQILASQDSPSAKAHAVIELLQPTHEWVFAPAAISLDWLDRCAQQTATPAPLR